MNGSSLENAYAPRKKNFKINTPVEGMERKNPKRSNGDKENQNRKCIKI